MVLLESRSAFVFEWQTVIVTPTKFLTLIVPLLATLFPGSARGARAEAIEPPARRAQPDVLLIMPDQLRGDCLSVLGHPAVRTPHLDELARQGVLFRRAYSTVPSCIPARRCLLTGLFPQTSGVVGYKAKPISVPTLPGKLAEAGYATVLVGRYMHQVPAHEPYGYQRQILGSTHVDGDEYDQALQKAAPASGGIRRLVAQLGITYNGWQAKPWPLAEELHPTTWIVNQARRVVAEAATNQPLFLTASFYAPHSPLFPPRRFFDKYLDMKLPPTAKGDWVDWPALSPKGDKAGHRVLLEGQALREAQAGYFGLIEHLDERVADLIEDFKARSRRAQRPWVIVVTSDHGELLGDHGYYRKCEPYEGSANIPFIIAGSPDLGFQAGQRCRQPVCLEDVLPTLLELAGAPRVAPVDGVSLVPVLRGEKRDIRDRLHFEHAPCYSRAQAFQALTDGRFKYIWRPANGREQLFDLDKDPREEHDLAQDASERERLAQWRARLVRRLADRPEGFSDGIRLIPGRPYPPLQSMP
jgi:arylsulfatase